MLHHDTRYTYVLYFFLRNNSYTISTAPRLTTNMPHAILASKAKRLRTVNKGAA